MPEFDLIRRLQQIIDIPAAHGPVGCVLGIGDDAAVLEPPAGRQIVVCTDTLVEGVHFPPDTDPRAVGYKSLAVNLSDLAAMGAEPAWFFLSLALPKDDPGWLDSFAHGMAGLSREAGIVLAGGDTTRGGLCITVTAVGHVPPEQALTRAGARPGDHILVSAETGRAAYALRCISDGAEPPAGCRQALDYPEPRLALGLALRGLASSCIDVSDGLAADLGHILERSGVGAVLELGRLPSTECLSALPDTDRWTLQTAGGDDYELCFTVPNEAMVRIAAIATETGIPLTDIGRITEGPDLLVRCPNGEAFDPAGGGYQHFFAQSGEEGAP